MSTAKTPTESARFKIANGETIVEFSAKGSMVALLDEAFGFLTTDRREKALMRMHATHKRLQDSAAAKAQGDAA